MTNKLIKKTTLTLITLLILIFLACFIISFKAGYKLCNPKRKDLSSSPSDLSLIYEDIEINSKKDNLRLSGWWIPAQIDNKIINSKNTLIFSHGYGGCRDQRGIINFYKSITNYGWNVIATDFRGCGLSEKTHTTMGINERYDLLATFEYAINKKHSENIILQGWSMGAVTSILTASEIIKNYPNESKYLKGIIAESAFLDLNDYFKDNMTNWINLPDFPFTFMSIFSMKLLYNMDFSKCSPINELQYLKYIPILFIHSKSDNTVPYSNTIRLYNSVKNKKICNIWSTNDSNHIEIYKSHPVEYVNKIENFMSKRT